MARGGLFACVCGFLLLGLTGPVLAGSEPPPLQGQASILRVGDTRIVAQLTGSSSRNDTSARWDVRGTDLGHTFRHRDRLYMVFGDTFGAGGLGRENWRSNVMALIADAEPRHGLPFETMITGPDGAAKELIFSRKIDGIEKTVIPTNGIALGGRMYLHYMSVRQWQEPGHWQVGHSGLAYSDDEGQSWRTPADAVWPEDSGFEQVAFARDGGFVHSFGIPEGRYGGVRLRRAAPERILVPAAYEYWNGADWVADASAAAVIVPAPVGELSVAWSSPHKRWLMLYLEPQRRAIVLRTAPQLTGPWGHEQVVVTADEYPGLYGPYIVAGSEIDADLYYTMSLWGPYNVFLMHTTLQPAAPETKVAERGQG